MINKQQWIVLPFSKIKDLPALRISPPRVIPQRERRSRWICDYSFYDVNNDTLELFAPEAMQYGHALDRILQEILPTNPELGPVYLKVDIADGFYRIQINIKDTPKLGVIFPTSPTWNHLWLFH